MSHQNCWEFKKCGRQPCGPKIEKLGICPVASFSAADGFGGGKNGGRACVYITGTFCSSTVKGTHKEIEKKCPQCDFYHVLKNELREEMTLMSFVKYVKQKINDNQKKKEKKIKYIIPSVS